MSCISLPALVSDEDNCYSVCVCIRVSFYCICIDCFVCLNCIVFFCLEINKYVIVIRGFFYELMNNKLGNTSFNWRNLKCSFSSVINTS